MATTNENIKGNIVIVGATGPSGLQLIEQALARGYKVTAPVRNPEKLSHIQNENLEVRMISSKFVSIHFHPFLRLFLGDSM